MDKTIYKCLWDIRVSLGEEKGSFFCLFCMVGWFELIVNHMVFVKGAVIIIHSIKSSQLLSVVVSCIIGEPLRYVTNMVHWDDHVILTMSTVFLWLSPCSIMTMNFFF